MQEDVIFQRPQTNQPAVPSGVPNTPPAPAAPPPEPTQQSGMPRDPLEAYEPMPQSSLPLTPKPATPPAQAQGVPQNNPPRPVSPTGVSQQMPPSGIPPIPPSEGMPLPLKIAIGLGGILVIIVIAFFIISHSSRGGGENITLTYWGLWEPPAVMTPIIADFERQHPNITINYSREDPRHYTQRLISRIPAGTGPDIYRFHSSWVPMLHSLLLPLSDAAISKADFQKEFYPVAQQDLVQNGAIYGIPMEIDTLSMFVNPRILQAAGVSVPQEWTQFQDDTRILTVKDDNHKIKTAGAAMGTFDNITHASDIVSMLFWQNGADPRNIAQTTQTQQYASQALSFYTNFANSDQNIWDQTLDPSKIAFSKENLAIYFGYSWDILDIKALNPNLNFAVYPVPHLPPPAPAMTVASYWVEGVSAKTQHPAEAMLFMNYLSQKSTEEALYAEEAKTRLFGEPYARSDLAGLLTGNQYLFPIIQQAKNAQPVFFAADTQDTDGISAQLSGYIGNAVRSAQAGTSADSAVQTLAQGVVQVLQQYGSK